MTTEERCRDRGVRPSRALPPLPVLHLGDPLLTRAKKIASDCGGYRYLTHPYYDDLVGAIALALVEGRCPQQAKREFLRDEYAWRRTTVQVYDGLEPFNGRLIRQSDEEAR